LINKGTLVAYRRMTTKHDRAIMPNIGYKISIY